MAEENAVEEEEKKKSPLMMIIIVAVACLGIGGGAAFFLLGSSSSDAEAKTDTEETAAEEETVAMKQAYYFSLDPAFVVNFQGKSRARFLQVNIDGMTREEVMKQEVTKHLPQIRNNIVMLLSSKTYDDLITPEGKENVRKEILTEIQKVMESETGKQGIENIFFTSFVMQ